jgi:FlaG/FlaF family flagellin (archaellin)
MLCSLVYAWRMRNTLLLLIFFISLPLCAGEVYKWTNAEGEVIYSDTYQEGAERIRVIGSKQPSAGAESQEQGDAQANTQDEAGYERLEIVQPENDATVRSNEGKVSVKLALTPTLGEGHSVKISIDGKELPGDVRSTQFTLNNLNRGTHSLATRIVDADGNVVISSNSVSFHLRQASILTP